MYVLRAWIGGLTLAIVIGAAGSVTGGAGLRVASAQERRTETYSTRGIVKAFGRERRTVSIAHEAIPGFMGAMTMSFEANSPDQLRDLAVDDRVRFSFAVADDGRRIIQSIAKEGR